MRESDEIIKNILENVDEGLIVIDREYKIISANKAYCNQVKMPAKNVIGGYCYKISHHMSRPCFEAGEDCSVRRTFETGEPCSAVHTHRDKNGNPIFIKLKLYPVKDALGNVISVMEIIHDVTEKRKLETQLLHARKMEAVRTLTSGIAHEFNNILTAIIGYGKLLYEEMNDDDPLRRNVNRILASSDRAAILIQSMLAFSRDQIINPMPARLNRVIKNAATGFLMDIPNISCSSYSEA
jgi:PAS domain S-box-containing protein